MLTKLWDSVYSTYIYHYMLWFHPPQSFFELFSPLCPRIVILESRIWSSPEAAIGGEMVLSKVPDFAPPFKFRA